MCHCQGISGANVILISKSLYVYFEWESYFCPFYIEHIITFQGDCTVKFLESGLTLELLEVSHSVPTYLPNLSDYGKASWIFKINFLCPSLVFLVILSHKWDLIPQQKKPQSRFLLKKEYQNLCSLLPKNLPKIIRTIAHEMTEPSWLCFHSASTEYLFFIHSHFTCATYRVNVLTNPNQKSSKCGTGPTQKRKITKFTEDGKNPN